MDQFRDATMRFRTIGGEHLSRRTLLRRSAALAFAMPAITTLLAACAEDEEDVGTEEREEETEAPEDVGDEAEADAEEDGTDGLAGEGQRGGTLSVTITGDLGTFDT